MKKVCSGERQTQQRSETIVDKYQFALRFELLDHVRANKSLSRILSGKLSGNSSTALIAEIEVTSWLVSADDFSSRVARGANE